MGPMVVTFLIVLWLVVLIPALFLPLFLDVSRLEPRQEPARLEPVPGPPHTAVRAQPRADRDSLAA